MKLLCVVVSLFVVSALSNDFCYTDSNNFCRGVANEILNCNANYSGFSENVHYLQSYTNQQISKSFDYLLLSTNFANYVKNRPGFEKIFRSLSDRAWNNAISLIKEITKRGGSHNFAARLPSNSIQQNKMLELSELNALAFALDVEKELAKEAHHIHHRYSHSHHTSQYDAEVTHYLEEEFIENQADVIRKLSGHTNDLKNMMTNTIDPALSLHLFDEFLRKE